jgi:NAD(P)-dependent dehydrogenase (short-subunit alcohol dehydrogenase family)
MTDPTLDPTLDPTPIHPPRPLDGLGVLVTGGGSGIGLAAAARLASDGAVVTICGRTASRLVDAVATIRDSAIEGAIGGGTESAAVDVEHVVADVTDEAAVAHAVGESIGPITQLDVDAWSRTLTQNVTGTMLALKHGGAAMVRSGGGSFVALSSLASATSHPWFGAYGPAKAGIDQLVRQAADELGPSGVRVNSVCPGLTRTDLVGFITAGGEVLDDYLANTPLGRIGEPEEVAELIRFLVGPESAWITGQAINIDGGQSVRRGPSLRAVLEPVFGADGLRGVVPEA